MRLRDLKTEALPGYAQVLCFRMREESNPPCGKQGKYLDKDPRDYAVLEGFRVSTFFGEYEVEPDVTREVLFWGGAILVHRRNLWRYLGVETARRFYHRGRRTRL